MRCMHAFAILVDGRREFVPCGKCNFCLEARRADWSFRLRQELKVSTSAQFLTLTYEKAPQENGVETLRKKDLQDFFKRFRKSCPTKVRYYAVGEYGSDTQRPHYHVLLYNAPLAYVRQNILAAWSHGIVDIGTVTDASIHYVTKYHVNKVGEFPGRSPPFCLMSRRPGLGSNYVQSHIEYHREDLRGYTRVNGMYGRLPRYYADKFFTKEEKAVMSGRAPSELLEYRLEISRLSKIMDDPYTYYMQRRRYAHDAVKHKSQDSDKI